MEKIISISEQTFKHPCSRSSIDGYVIVTDKQTIKVGITNSQHCCENWGYLHSEDDLSYFIGANLINISLTDTAYGNVSIDIEKMGFHEVDTIFVNFITDKGLLQLAAYNSHNGYYGHTIIIESKQLKVIDVL